jgi:cell fate (sporulation/competence/biofilm development) regulator YlbF (YheA/YmcA/DUF963 family)
MTISDAPTSAASVLDQKIHDLCQAILTDAQVSSSREQIDAFLEDDDAREIYAAVMQKSDELQQKQRSGAELTDEDIIEYNRLRDRAFSDPRVQSFQMARGHIQEVEDKIVAYVEKTLELGRIPTPDEVVRQGGGCCGGGGGGGCSSGGCGC